MAGVEGTVELGWWGRSVASERQPPDLTNNSSSASVCC